MLLEAARSHLLVVDVQARLMPAIHEGEAAVANVLRLVAAAGALEVPITVTEQYPQGLGTTLDAVRERLPAGSVVLPKITFSAAADAGIAARAAALRGEGRDQLVICGAEAHVCVLQTALGFREQGFAVAVAADAASSRTPESVAAAKARLLHAGVLSVTTEMVLFEWLGRAGTDQFRALLPLIR